MRVWVPGVRKRGGSGVSATHNRGRLLDTEGAADLLSVKKTTFPAWMPDRPLLLTQRQAAALLNVCERTIRNLIRKRKLPVKFIGRRCLIPAAAVEEFARQVAHQ